MDGAATSEKIFTREELAKLQYYLIVFSSKETRQLANVIRGKSKAVRAAGLDELAAMIKGRKDIAAMLLELAAKKERDEERERLGLTFRQGTWKRRDS